MQFFGRRVPVAVLAAALLVISCSATASAGTPLRTRIAGTWSGRYSGAYAGSFTLSWTLSGSILSGTIKLSNPRGRFGINGSVRGTAIHFGVVKAGATYTGTVSGTSMSGSYLTQKGPGKWSAHKVSS